MKTRTQWIFWFGAAAFLGLLLGWCVNSFALMDGKPGIEKMIYPIVRVSTGSGAGSGTVICSAEKGGKFDTYILTNYHVIASAISFEDVWDSIEKKQVKKEKRDIVYVEVFQYRSCSIPVGTLKVEAEIVAHKKDEDMAILKPRTDTQFTYTAKLYPKGKEDELLVFEQTTAVGCALGLPPIPTVGHLTRKGFLIDSKEFWMSSAPIIFGNSGGAMFRADTAELIGIPSMVANAGMSVVTHVGIFIPIHRIYQWFAEIKMEFLVP